MTAIGFVGLGVMGSRISGRLLEGNMLYGTNRTASRAGELIRRGMVGRGTPRAVADGMLAKAAELGYARRDIAAFFEVLAQIAGGPGATARPAGSGMAAAGTARSTP